MNNENIKTNTNNNLTINTYLLTERITAQWSEEEGKEEEENKGERDSILWAT